MRRSVAALTAAFCLTSAVLAQELHTWGEELDPIFDALGHQNSAFLLLSENQDSSSLPSVPDFSRLATTGNSSFENLKKTVATKWGMQVHQDSSGVFLIKERNVPSDILQIRIRHLKFADFCFDRAYSANRALMIIFQAPELMTYAKAHDIWLSPPMGNGGITGGMGCGLPPPGVPGLSGTLDNLTVWQALQKVFQAFPGEILAYWNSPKPSGKENIHKTTPLTLPNFYTACQRPGLPDPFCLPPTEAAGQPVLFPIRVDPPPQRRVRLWFFRRTKFGQRTIITSG